MYKVYSLYKYSQNPEFANVYSLYKNGDVLPTIIEEREIFEGSIRFKAQDQEYVVLIGYTKKGLLPATSIDINNKYKAVKKEALLHVSRIDSGYFLFDKRF